MKSQRKAESMAIRIDEWMPAVEQWIPEHKEELIQEVQALVRIPSVSCPDQAVPGAPFGLACRRVLDHMLARGEAYGFRTRDLDGWAGTVSMGDEENAFGIVAHLDVVPVGDGWVYPPFEAVYLPERDAIIGRGGDDNKGPAVSALFVMRMIRDLKIPLKHGVRLYCGVSEENGMMDMAHLRDHGEPFPVLTLVPDAGFPVNYGQKGSLKGAIRAKMDGNLLSFRSGSVVNVIPDLAECEVAVDPATARKALDLLPEHLRNTVEMEETAGGILLRANGVSGHAAAPENSINAIHLLAAALSEMDILTGSGKSVIRALRDLSSDSWCISEGADFEDDISGKTTLVYSTAMLADGLLTVGLDCRYSITYESGTLREKLEKAWAELGFEPAEITVSQPFYIPKDDPRVVALQEVYQRITGRDDPPYTMGGGTYSRVVPNAISFGFGMPGTERDLSFLPEGHGHAHGRDEILWLEKLAAGMKIYLGALLELDRMNIV